MASDALAMVEQRCLQMVLMAETKAAEQRKELEARIAELQNQHLRTTELLENDVTQCEVSLQSTSHLLSSVSAEFAAAHAASDAAIRRLLDLRAASETSAFQRIKLAIAEFRDYRHQMKKNALWRIAQSHRDTLNAQATTSSSVLPYHTTGGALVDSTSPFAPERRLLEELSRKFSGAAQQHDTDETPFMLDAVFAYLIGAIESLMKFGDTIAGQLQRAARLEDQLRRHFLLDEERAILKRNAGKLAPAQPDMITSAAVVLVFVKRLADDRESRHDTVLRIIGDACAEATASAKARAAWHRDVFKAATNHFVSTAMQTPSVYVNDDGAIVVPSGIPAMAAAGPSSTASSLALMPHVSNSTAGPRKVTSAVALQLYQQYAADAEARLFCRLVEKLQHECETLRGDFGVVLDELRRASQHADITVHHDVTVFSLEQLTQETERRMLLNKVVQDRYVTLELKNRRQVQQLQDQIAALNVQLEEAKLQRADALRLLSQKDAELAHLDQVMALRHKSGISLRPEIRQVNYEVNVASFGESWQESLLNLRSRILNDLRDDNLRFIAKISHMIRTHMGDESQMEQLFEVRLRTALQELEADNKRKAQEAKRRFAAERQLLHDEMELRLKALRDDCEREKAAYKQTVDEDYERKVVDLNALYDAKRRQCESRVAAAEGFFASKLAELQRAIQDRGNQLEVRSAERDVSVLSQYESEAAQLKRNLSDREHVLEAERMKIMTSVETKIHDKVMRVRHSFDTLLKQLQDTVFGYAEAQRRSFEEQRAKEHHIFSHFMFGSIRSHQEAGRQELVAALERTEFEASEAIKRQADAVFHLQFDHETQMARSEQSFTARTIQLKNVQELMLRKTQDLRCEQEAKFWSECLDRIRTANQTREDTLTAAQRLMQQRYIDIITQVNQYLQNDVMAAHQTFERECRLRQMQLQGWVNHFHKITLQIESMMWLEVCGRCAIEKEYYSATSSYRLMMVEERRTLEYCAQLDQQPFADLNQVTFYDIDDVRRRYEKRVEEQREHAANMAHDYLTALAAALREQKQAGAVMSGLFQSRLEALAVALKDRFAVYTEARDYAINRELQRIVESVQKAVLDFVREDQDGRPGRDDDSGSSSDSDSGGVIRTPLSPRSGNGGRVGRKASPGGSPRRRARSAGANLGGGGSTVKDATTAFPSRLNIKTEGAAAKRAHDIATRSSGSENAPVSSSSGRGNRRHRDHSSSRRSEQVALHEEHHRLVEYFAGLRTLLSKAFEELDDRVAAAAVSRDASISALLKKVHDEYLQASTSTMKRLEDQQHLIDERDAAIVQLASRVDVKVAAEVKAAVLAEDLGVLAHKYDLLSRGWMLHATVAEQAPVARRDPIEELDDNFGEEAASPFTADDGEGPLSPGGVIRDHYEQFGSAGHSNRVLLAFVSDLGGKRPTRNAVVENVQMRERLVAQEWFGDDLLRESMYLAALNTARGDAFTAHRSTPQRRHQGSPPRGPLAGTLNASPLRAATPIGSATSTNGASRRGDTPPTRHRRPSTPQATRR